MHFNPNYYLIIISIFWFGCATPNSKTGADYGASLVPADSNVVMKGSIGEILNETGIHDNASIINRFIKKRINELEESGRDEELIAALKQALDFDSIGLAPSQPVYAWVKIRMKEFTFGQGRTESLPQMTVGIAGSISDKLKAEEGLKKLITEYIFPTETTGDVTERPWNEPKGYQFFGSGNSRRGNRCPGPVAPAPKSAPEKGDAAPATGAVEQKTETKKNDLQLPWIQRNGHKALLAVGDPVRIRGEEVDRQSLAIALTDNSFVIVLSALASDQPDIEELVSQWLPNDTEKGEDDSPEAIKERKAKKELFAQLLDMLEGRINSPSRAKGD